MGGGNSQGPLGMVGLPDPMEQLMGSSKGGVPRAPQGTSWGRQLIQEALAPQAGFAPLGMFGGYGGLRPQSGYAAPQPDPIQALYSLYPDIFRL